MRQVAKGSGFNPEFTGRENVFMNGYLKTGDIGIMDEDGFTKVKTTFTKLKDGRNSWGHYKYCKPEFPLIKDQIYKDNIEKFWDNKDVRFAYMNNCVGCWWRSPLLLKKMHTKHPNKIQWFADQETDKSKFKSDVKYSDIIKWKTQIELFDDDFNECDSGYCGL